MVLCTNWQCTQLVHDHTQLESLKIYMTRSRIGRYSDTSLYAHNNPGGNGKVCSQHCRTASSSQQKPLRKSSNEESNCIKRRPWLYMVRLGWWHTDTSGDIAYFPIPAIQIASVTTASTPDTPRMSSATQKQRYAAPTVSVISSTVSLRTHDHRGRNT